MDKSKHKPYDAKRAFAVKYVAVKFDCTSSHVRAIITGKFDGGRAEEIRRAFNEKYAELKSVLS